MSTLIEVKETKKSSASVQTGTTFSAQEVRYYDVLYDTPLTATIDAIYASGVPAFGAALGTGSLILKNKTSDRDEEKPSLYRVTCTYELPTPGQDSTPGSIDPDGTRWAIDIGVQSVPYEYEVQYDINGYPIQNTAGDAVGGVMTSDSDEQYTVTFTSNIIDWDGIDASKNAINSEPFSMTFNGQERDFDAYTVRFLTYSLSYVLDDTGTQYPRVTYVLLYRITNWLKKIASKGLNEYDIVLDAQIPIRDGQGNPITTPVYLDADGLQLGVGDTVSILKDPITSTGGLHIFNEVDLLSELLWDIGT